MKAKLDEVNGTSAPTCKAVYNWVNEFKRGRRRTSTHNELRSERPVQAATPEIIEKVHDMILYGQRVKVREIVEAMGISHGTAILQLKFCMRNCP